MIISFVFLPKRTCACLELKETHAIKYHTLSTAKDTLTQIWNSPFMFGFI